MPAILPMCRAARRQVRPCRALAGVPILEGMEGSRWVAAEALDSPADQFKVAFQDSVPAIGGRSYLHAPFQPGEQPLFGVEQLVSGADTDAELEGSEQAPPAECLPFPGECGHGPGAA